MNDLIINAAVTGMVPTRKQNPAVPISPKEIVADARRCFEAGASVIHVHARGEDEAPHYSKELYAETAARQAHRGDD